MAQPVELGSRKYAALHKARVSGGAFLYVPANTSVALPIEIFQWVEGENASVFPHTLIICGENSSVTVVDYFKSADKLPAFACGVNDLVTVDVLADPDVRQGIKEYANWPTIPQLYIKGEFVGGSDIMREMYQSGELQKMLQG